MPIQKRELLEIDDKRFIVDPITGEATEVSKKDGQIIYIATRKKLSVPFVIFEQRSLSELSTSGLSALEYKVFIFILSHLEYENVFPFRQDFISDELKHDRPSISRAISGLLQAGVLIDFGFDGRTDNLRANPLLVWKGDHQKRTKLIKYLIENNLVDHKELTRFTLA